ncbi:D-aminoacyl-tRNA deacylase [Bacteroidota bacterium]
MIGVIQRVSESSVKINEEIKSQIGKGLLILVGIENADEEEDIQWLAKKIINLRVFDDDEGVMNESIIDHSGDILVISQFTLHASTRKGNRPSYLKAAKPDIAIPLYNRFVGVLGELLGKPVHTGEFGADMKVGLVNDGPVTIIIDTKEKK